MIPKRLFFIWIGDNKPDYVNFSINAFKNINKEFEIELILEKTIFCDNKDFNIVKEEIENKSNEEYNEIIFGKWTQQYIKTEKGKISRFVDCLKIHYINKYGGIYLDCDTFPVRPFDDNLLSHGFYSYSHLGKRILKDRFFIGCDKNEYSKITHKIIFDMYSNNTYKKNYVPKKMKQERDLFFKCLLKQDIDKDYVNYIKHFKALEWS